MKVESKDIRCERERIDWVDSMRGFTMVLVVFAHAMWPFGISGEKTLVGTWLMTFRMPLFFFVSGFFSYKALSRWTFIGFKSIIKRKIQAQIIGTLVFLSLFQFCFDFNFKIDGIQSYWFTVVLFQMYCCYLLSVGLSRLFRYDIVMPLMVAISIYFLLSKHSNYYYLVKFLSWQNLDKYMQFFTAGLIASRYRDKLFFLLGHHVFYSVALIGWVAILVYRYTHYYNENCTCDIILSRHLISYFGIATVLSIFYRSADWFSSSNLFARISRKIGQRTLDIYFLHFFFIPMDAFLFLSDWLLMPRNILLQFLCPLFLALIIVAICMLVSKLMHLSAFLSSWLFGSKTKSVSMNHEVSKLVR